MSGRYHPHMVIGKPPVGNLHVHSLMCGKIDYSNRPGLESQNNMLYFAMLNFIEALSQYRGIVQKEEDRIQAAEKQFRMKAVNRKVFSFGCGDCEMVKYLRETLRLEFSGFAYLNPAMNETAFREVNANSFGFPTIPCCIHMSERDLNDLARDFPEIQNFYAFSYCNESKKTFSKIIGIHADGKQWTMFEFDKPTQTFATFFDLVMALLLMPDISYKPTLYTEITTNWPNMDGYRSQETLDIFVPLRELLKVNRNMKYF